MAMPLLFPRWGQDAGQVENVQGAQGRVIRIQTNPDNLCLVHSSLAKRVQRRLLMDHGARLALVLELQ
jgi:hypothetical protein